MSGNVGAVPEHAGRVCIIGAGISGIAMAVALKRAGLDDFELLEANDGLGGTWLVNDYPGAAVDIASITYQYSFRLNPWRRTHALQAELLEYLREVAKEHDLEPHLRVGRRVTDVVWDERTHRHIVTTADGRVRTYDVVVSAVGTLSTPSLPAWPGIDQFKGAIFHSAQWDHGVELVGKRVAVVGVGSSSAQIVPAIAPVAEHVYVFQREPNWVLPKGARDYTPEELRRYASPARQRLRRLRLNAKKQWSHVGAPYYVPGTRRSREFEQLCREHIDRVFADRPDLREAMTPKYPFAGKRQVMSDDFYPAFLRDNVTLVPRAVKELTPTAVRDAGGDEHPVDVIITATGFTAASYLSGLEVVGRGGRRLREAWADGAYANVGLTVPGFPNFYLLYGPNTNGAGHFSINSLVEIQASRVVADLRRMDRRSWTALDTSTHQTALYNRWLQRRLRRTSWAGTGNYMKTAAGRIVTQFDGSPLTFAALTWTWHPLSRRGARR